MVKKQKMQEYSSLRITTILLTTIMLPFGTFVGFEFGAKHTKVALISLAVETLLTLIQSHIWWRTLERAKAK